MYDPYEEEDYESRIDNGEAICLNCTYWSVSPYGASYGIQQKVLAIHALNFPSHAIMQVMVMKVSSSLMRLPRAQPANSITGKTADNYLFFMSSLSSLISSWSFLCNKFHYNLKIILI